jgi:hypothetical protein
VNELQPFTERKNLPAPIVENRKKPSHYVVGVHVENHGEVAAVWLGVDWEDSKRKAGRVTLCDSVVFPRETPLPVIVDSIRGRGEWKPIAWRNEDEAFVDLLKERGCVRLEGYDETQAMCEATTRELAERFAAETFKVVDTNEGWVKEFSNLVLKDGVVPLAGYPLLSATRHALQRLRYAREWKPRKRVEAHSWGGSIV